MTITITVPSRFVDEKPTIIVYRDDKRFWTGYDHNGNYVENKWDRMAKKGHENEVKWAQANGYEVVTS